MKWFCSYDTKLPPLPLAQVLTPAFLAVAIAFSAVMFFAYLVDHAADRHGWLNRIERVLLRCEPCAPLLVGKVDAIGHSLIIVGLVAMFIMGQQGIQLPHAVRRAGALARSSVMTLAYGATIATLFGLYYSAQYLAG